LATLLTAGAIGYEKKGTYRLGRIGDGHEPREVAEWFAQILTTEGYEAAVSETLEAFDDVEKFRAFDLIVLQWTMGELTRERAEAITPVAAVLSAR
jgi:type 1 glutamine amidotransferase